jgi:cytochrome o ubiquinol oxidase subunit 2
MNAFFVPQLGSMIAAMNGMVTELHLQADHAGDYYGESTQFSGDGFAEMNFLVHALPPEAFAAWVRTTRQAGGALDRAAYEQLARQSRNVAPSTYGAVDADLFRMLLSQQIPPAPGPAAGQGAVTVHPSTGS